MESYVCCCFVGVQRPVLGPPEPSVLGTLENTLVVVGDEKFNVIRSEQTACKKLVGQNSGANENRTGC